MRHDVALTRNAVRDAGRLARIRLPRILRLSIAQRIFLVGAIPIVIAVVIGVASILLLNRADDARRGALTVATVFRHVVTAMSERDAYVGAGAAMRGRHLGAFSSAVAATDAGLISLDAGDGESAAAVAATRESLQHYRVSMGELKVAIARNDLLLSEMDARLATLLALTDEARSRQRASNADVVTALRQRDEALRAAQELVTAGQRVRVAVVDQSMGQAAPAAPASPAFAAARLANAVSEFSDRLRAAGLATEATAFAALAGVVERGAPPDALLAWIDRRLKIDGTAARALQEEVAELLTYTVEAHETEQATQNIAVEMLKLTDRTARALQRRDINAITVAVDESRSLGERIAALPISPLIQTEMLDALDRWRSGLTDAGNGLAAQNEILERMQATASAMVFEVSSLNTALSQRADAIGAAARNMLILGAGFGLAAGALFGILVARSITRPLKRLEQDMLHRAHTPDAGPLRGSGRRDEIGHMARATNHFLRELGNRETALRAAKERTEQTLKELKRTQNELIQSEKLASLGQLVAGVAHEINTPLGVALTTATVLREEAGGFRDATREGRVTRAAFDGFVERMNDGARLMSANLQRSAHLVQSFKQVAADQASGERRAFRMDAFIDDLFTSLGPMGKRAGHQLEIRCERGIDLVSYPGALAQVLTNLLTNAYTHAFAETETGTIRVEVSRCGNDTVRLVFADDGRGIAPVDRPRIFDPFFTTGRAKGSTGLGLHIVYNLVTATLGGTINVWSEPGKGTRFTINIPRERTEQSDGAATREA